MLCLLIIKCLSFQGCNHDRGASNACDPQGRFRDILAYACTPGQCSGYSGTSACNKTQRFSNNYANFNTYNEIPIGNAQNDTTRRINNVALTVSNYCNRQSTPTLPSLYTTLITNIALTVGSICYYYMDFTAGQIVSCSTNGPNGDADLYLCLGSEAVLDTEFTGNACSSTSEISIDLCSIIAASGPTKVYAAVHAYSAFSGLTFQCTKLASTSSPTSAPPTSAHPMLSGMAEPTTCKPSTRKPTTHKPTSYKPTQMPTNEPTTESPTTESPTTDSPTTESPTTDSPATISPTTNSPTTDTPTTDTPTTNSPTTAQPTSKPNTSKRSTHNPTTQKPTTRIPTTRKPIL